MKQDDYRRQMPVGSEQRPHAPVSQADYAKVPTGHYYRDPNGAVARKGFR